MIENKLKLKYPYIEFLLSLLTEYRIYYFSFIIYSSGSSAYFSVITT